MSVIVDIADAVVTVLNANDFSVAFEAARAYVPRAELKALDGVQVTVVPRSIAVEPITRVQDSQVVEIHVGIQQSCSADDLVALDALMDLVQEVRNYLKRRHLSNAKWLSIENAPIYDPAHLREKNVFTSLITVTYQANW